MKRKEALILYVGVLICAVVLLWLSKNENRFPLSGEMEVEYIRPLQNTVLVNTMNDKRFGSRELEITPGLGMELDGVQAGDRIWLEYEIWPDDPAYDVFDDFEGFEFNINEPDRYVVVGVKEILLDGPNSYVKK